MIVKLYSQRPSPIPLLLLIPRILGSLNVKLEGMEISTHLLIILYIHMLQLYLLHHDLIHANQVSLVTLLGKDHFPHRLPHKKGQALQYHLLILGSSQPVYFSQPLEWGQPSQYHGSLFSRKVEKGSKSSPKLGDTTLITMYLNMG